MLGYRSALLVLLLVRCSNCASYSNVTLTANDGDLSVVIYLPDGIKNDGLPTYYVSSRFEHGSMIGSIQRKVTKEDGTQEIHTLYGGNQWRMPHEAQWPESGIGLASEFGVGDDGAFCNYRCGWYEVNEVTNGVLRYLEAKNGESFLKIGVGELKKGSCKTCDSTDDFKFNSEYEFVNPPVWSLQENEETNSISLEHEATLNLGEYGYRVRKDITLNDDELLVKTTLINIGRVQFATAWYSHHFFTCDSRPVGRGYSLDLDLPSTGGKYEEPGTWFWSSPLEGYASVKPLKKNGKQKVSVVMERGLESSTRIKAEFTKDEASKGAFTIHGCDTSVYESIPEVGTDRGVSMYAFNLYVESGTFSPEPQIYLHLAAGEDLSWTQRLQFSDYKEREDRGIRFPWFGLKSISSSQQPHHPTMNFVFFVAISSFLTFFIHRVWKRRRGSYTPIPDDFSAL